MQTCNQTLRQRLTDAVLECVLDAVGKGAVVESGEAERVVRLTVAEAEGETGPEYGFGVIDWEAGVETFGKRWLVALWMLAIYKARGVRDELAAAMYRRGDGWVVPVDYVPGRKEAEAAEVVDRVVEASGKRKRRERERDNAAVRRLVEWRDKQQARGGVVNPISVADMQTGARQAREEKGLAGRMSGPVIEVADAQEVMHEQLSYLALHVSEGECQDVACRDCERLRLAIKALWEPVAH